MVPVKAITAVFLEREVDALSTKIHHCGYGDIATFPFEAQ